MANILDAQKAFSKLLDIEYQFVLGRKDKNEKYFCKTFFPQGKKDYTERQTKWTVLFKKKIVKSTNTETVLYKNKNFEIK